MATSSKYRNLVFVAVLIFGSEPLKPQEGGTNNIPPEIYFQRTVPDPRFDGRNVNCLLQDQKGFMWFGTTWGLVRYDGHEVTVYQNDVRDTTSLSGNHVLSLYEDRQGTIWAGTLIHGLNRYDRRSGKFQRFKHNPDDSTSLLNDQVYAIYQDRSGTLWVGTTYGLNRLNGVNKGFTRFLHNKHSADSASFASSKAIYEDNQGHLWVGTWARLYRFNQERKIDSVFVHDPENPNSLSGNDIIAIRQDRQGNLWFGSEGGGLNRYDPLEKQVVQYLHAADDSFSLSNNVVRALHEDRLGNLWVGTEGGINLYDRRADRFIRFQHDPENDHSLNSNFVTAIAEDHTGTMWIATGSMWGQGRGGGYGLNKWDREQAQFRHLADDPAHSPRIAGTGLHVLMEDRDGFLWLGTWRAGLIRLDRNSGDHVQFLHDPANPRSISQSSVMSLYEDRQGILWVGTADRGLNRMDRRNNTFTAFLHDPQDASSLGNNRVVAINEDHIGRLWVATFGGGLNLFDRESGTFTRFMNDPNDPRSIGHNLVTEVLEDHTGTIWIGTWGAGINRFVESEKRFIRYNHDPRDSYSISNPIIWSLYEDQSGNIWTGTTGGLNKLDRESGRFICYTTRDGLSNNMVFSMLEDDRGRLWLGTNRGMTLFDPEHATFRIFNRQDGLKNTSYAFGTPGKTRDGLMMFGGGGGIDIFHPDSIRDNPYVPPVVFTRFTGYGSGSADGAKVVDQHISEKEEIAIPHDAALVTFDFAALNFRNSEKNEYQYFLEGVTEDWIFLGKQRSITISNLAPGSYTLRVKGSNNDGIWNESGAALSIRVWPPWWRTWWAYAIYSFLALSILYGLRRYELNRQQLKHALELEHLELEKGQQEAEKLKELDRMKTRFFANISHEFRTPLTLILGPLEQLISKKEHATLQDTFLRMQRNGQRLQRLINQLLDLSKLEAGKMRLNIAPVKVVQLVKFIATAFESLAGIRGIDLKLQLPDGEVLADLDRDKVEKVLTNLISNALKFTPQGGEVAISMRVIPSQRPDWSEREQIEIVVKDNGPGISLAQQPHVFDRFYQADDASSRQHEGTGIGLALSNELVKLHGGEIHLKSEPGYGTSFNIVLPLREAQPANTALPQPAKDNRKFDIVEVTGQEHRSSSLESLAPQSETVATDPATVNAATILIVEDNPDMRTYIATHLQQQYRILQAPDGRRGLRLAQQQGPDLIISDIMMPEMDGFELCKKLKTGAATSHIPVILLTARASGDSKIEGLETGADNYLTKPFNAHELKLRVRNLLAQRERMRERFRRELTIEPADITVTSMDEAFLKKVMAAVEAHIDQPAFVAGSLAQKAGLSPRQLTRKLRALTGQSPREFIRTIRLKRAAQLLQKNAGTVTEICFEVGFQSIAHFAKAFRKQFEVTPSQFRKKTVK